MTGENDPVRLEKIGVTMATLWSYWMENPHLRFGQIIHHISTVTGGTEVWNIDVPELLDGLERIRALTEKES